jgi:quercetin dioxygenase-like cupin family protein
METAAARDGTYERGDEARFTGEVWLRKTLAGTDETDIVLVHFSPAARTHWHRHPAGQFLVGLAGRGRVRSRGETGCVLEPSDVIYVGPDEWHFHGGTTTDPLVHVAVNGGGAPEWGAPVTDAEFEEGFSSGGALV